MSDNTVMKQLLFGARGRQGLVASLLIVIGALILAMPVGAAQPEPSLPSTTLSVNTCTFTVTYTWAGLKGGGFTAGLTLVAGTGTLDDQELAYFEVVHQTGRSGSVSHDFVLANGASSSRDFYARATLLKRGVLVSGSLADSTTVSSTCGDPIP